MKSTLLLILDGFGIAPTSPKNAISLAPVPTLHKLLSLEAMVPIQASGRAVGLPEGFIGNSEVGHLNIGAGTIVYQDMTKIDVAIENKEFSKNPVILQLLEKTKQAKGRVHFLGLISDGGVHSHVNHVKALVEMAHAQHVPAFVHGFLDGRDTAPTSAVYYLEQLMPILSKNNASLGTICGRFYAMDRDNRWERVEEAYKLLTEGVGQLITNPITALQEAYAHNENDEFIKPRLINEDSIIRDNDSIFFFNFRADRARELVSIFISSSFTHFNRNVCPKLSAIATMTAYDSSFNLPIAFPKQNLTNTVGERISALNIPQLRIAETEKYAHVTYFFNGGREEPFPLEERILVPSPKEVATYDLKPEMSAEEVTSKLINAIKSKKYQFIVCNLANPDMVGHTGIMEAAIKALVVIDNCVEKILKTIDEEDWRVIITSDHGNIEEMLDSHNQPQTAHTLNPTPLILIDKNTPLKISANNFSKLGDIAKMIFE